MSSVACAYCGRRERKAGERGYFAADGSFYCGPHCETQHLREMLARARDAAVRYAMIAAFHVPSFLRDPEDVADALRIRGLAVFDGKKATLRGVAQAGVSIEASPETPLDAPVVTPGQTTIFDGEGLA